MPRVRPALRASAIIRRYNSACSLGTLTALEDLFLSRLGGAGDRVEQPVAAHRGVETGAHRRAVADAFAEPAVELRHVVARVAGQPLRHQPIFRRDRQFGELLGTALPAAYGQFL